MRLSKKILGLLTVPSLLSACEALEDDSHELTGVAQTALSFPGMSASQVSAAQALPGLQRLEVDALGIPSYLEADLGVLHDDPRMQQAELEALRATLAPLLRMQGQEQLKVRSVFRDQRGKVHTRLLETIAGIDVIGAELIVHSDAKTSKIEGLRVQYLPDAGLPRQPGISADKIYAAIPSDELTVVNGRPATTPRLVYFRSKDGVGYLGWDILVTRVIVAGEVPEDCPTVPPEPPPVEQIVVDSTTGHVLRRHGLEQSALFRKVYSQEERDVCGGIPEPELRLVEGGSSTTQTITDAYNYSGMAYAFFANNFGRDSWDGFGGHMVSVVRTSGQSDNSFWVNDHAEFGNGDGITFGPFTRAPDIVAHEFTHGVIQATADLVYSNESGALNESIADIFGVSAEAAAWGLTADSWKVGMLAYTPGIAGDALRYMNNPRLDRKPGNSFFSSDYYPERYIGGQDSGGVHLNSGISNLAFYLLSQGGSHPRLNTGVTVAGVGIAKAQQIFYAALTTRLHEDDGFAQMRWATAEAAASLYGAFSAEKASVCRAWDAVCVPASANCPTPPSCIGPVPESPTNVSLAFENCRDLNTVTWTGAGDYYEIIGYPIPSDLSRTNLLYSGTAAPAGPGSFQKLLPISDGVFVRVKVCNNSGCSEVSSSGGFARAVSGCR